MEFNKDYKQIMLYHDGTVESYVRDFNVFCVEEEELKPLTSMSYIAKNLVDIEHSRFRVYIIDLDDPQYSEIVKHIKALARRVSTSTYYYKLNKINVI